MDSNSHVKMCENDKQHNVFHMWFICIWKWSMIPRYNMDTAGTRHRLGRDTNFTCKKWSIEYDTTRYVAHFEVSVHHRKWFTCESVTHVDHFPITCEIDKQPLKEKGHVNVTIPKSNKGDKGYNDWVTEDQMPMASLVIQMSKSLFRTFILEALVLNFGTILLPHIHRKKILPKLINYTTGHRRV